MDGGIPELLKSLALCRIPDRQTRIRWGGGYKELKSRLCVQSIELSTLK
jgi:hypothetical protein